MKKKEKLKLLSKPRKTSYNFLGISTRINVNTLNSGFITSNKQNGPVTHKHIESETRTINYYTASGQPEVTLDKVTSDMTDEEYDELNAPWYGD